MFPQFILKTSGRKTSCNSSVMKPSYIHRPKGHEI